MWLFGAILILYCVAREPLDHFAICAGSNHEDIQLSICYAAQYNTTENMSYVLDRLTPKTYLFFIKLCLLK
jgi:hypothetical protein